MDKDTLKKHHFWVLLGVLAPVLLVVLIGVFGVAGASEEQSEKIKAAEGKLNVTPQGRGMLDVYEEQKTKIESSRGKMWKQAWDAQKEIFVRPDARSLPRLQELTFGDSVPNAERVAFRQGGDRSIYRKMYDDLADSIKPTRFAGGSWKSVLTYVEEFSTAPTSEEIWLALEDYWVQREVLKVVDRVNDQIADFQPVDEHNDQNKFHRKFRSRLWELDLKLTNKGEERVLEGVITNVSGRMQKLGTRNTMTLKVYLDKQRRFSANYNVEGEAIAAGQTVEVKPIPGHTLDPSVIAQELYDVEQVFDSTTVPIKMVRKLGMYWPSARTVQYFPLKMTSFSQQVVENATPEGGDLSSPGTTGGGGADSYDDAAPGGEYAAMMGMGGDSALSSTALTPNNGLMRERYIATTGQVRRMPVALSLILDQSYMQDVLVAFANSPLRFQNTQFHWKRYRGGLSGRTGMGSGMYGPGESGDDSYPMEDAGAPGESDSGFEGTPMGGFPAPGIPYGPPAPGSPYPGSTPGTSASRQPAPDRSLIDLTVYGTASLYEKYQENPSESEGDLATAGS